MVEIKIYKPVQEANDAIAADNRARLHAAGIGTVNLISSPGAGKTTLLLKTLERLQREVPCGVIEGDIATDRDARRLAHLGLPVAQITTDGACHLDAAMVQQVLRDFPLDRVRLLVIENVGNLVCPASYDLGEDAKAVLISVPEGDDKPAKYPTTLLHAQAVVLTKTDLLPHCPFSADKFWADVAGVNPRAEQFSVSAATGEGLDAWCAWLCRQMPGK